MEFLLEFILDFIFDGILILLQGMGAIVRWLAFVGDRKPEYLIKQKQLNAFVGTLIIAFGIGLGFLINNY